MGLHDQHYTQDAAPRGDYLADLWEALRDDAGCISAKEQARVDAILAEPTRQGIIARAVFCGRISDKLPVPQPSERAEADMDFTDGAYRQAFGRSATSAEKARKLIERAEREAGA